MKGMNALNWKIAGQSAMLKVKNWFKISAKDKKKTTKKILKNDCGFFDIIFSTLFDLLVVDIFTIHKKSNF